MRGADSGVFGADDSLFAASLELGGQHLSLNSLRECLRVVSKGLHAEARSLGRRYGADGKRTTDHTAGSALLPYDYWVAAGSTRRPDPAPQAICAASADAGGKAMDAQSEHGDGSGSGEDSGSEAAAGRDKRKARSSGGSGAGDSGDGSGGSDSDGSDEAEDDGVVRCVCGERNDGELMIQCERCQVWQHTLCMGIRDETHVPDKYYCEECEPDDHPYINSRPRSVVLAEASSLGATTMMRRSAVMAVAKMSAREEYRSAAAAAAIAASVAAAAGSERAPSSRSRSARRTPKRQPKQGAVTPRSRRRGTNASGGRPRRQPRDPDGAEPDESSNEYEARAASSANGSEALADEANGSARKSAGRRRGASGTQGKRAGHGADADARSKRRKVGSQSQASSTGGDSGEPGARPSGDSDENAYAEDLVAQMMQLKPRTPKSRTRSVSTVVKRASSNSADGDVDEAAAGPPRFEFKPDPALERRGKSAPGSPRAQSSSRSPSPSLQSLLYGYGDAAPRTNSLDRPAKRKRGGGGRSGGASSKHQRMAVSASNSPFLQGGSLGAFGDALALQPHAGSADARDKGPHSDATDDDAGQRAQPPPHNHPPLQMADINGNAFTMPSNMLNAAGQPMYSSAEPDSMCRIRYPHSKASLYELNRRAKQLLEWLGKTQVEYEHERKSWLKPLACSEPLAAQSPARPEPEPESRLSEAPTSPIHPSEWPEDDEYDGVRAKVESPESQPLQLQKRSTVSIMEDLVWRLIRFQESYSS